MSRTLVVGAFAGEEELLSAVRAARRKSLAVHDVYTPFPVHGMDEAMGLAPSKLPKACFVFGMTGLTLAVCFQYWVSLFDWPMNIGGKTYDASPALVPIAFELTILFAGLGSVAAFLRMRRLFPGRKPAIEGLGGLDDRFLLALRQELGRADAQTLRSFLESQGACEVRELKEAA